MRRRRPIALAAALVLLVLPILAAPVGARDPDRIRHERTLAYWTAERIATAIPRDFELTGVGFRPVAKPPGTPGGGSGGGGGGGGGGDGGGSEPTVTGSSWTKEGPITGATGRVLFTMSGTNYICSGTTVADTRATVSIVLTAAHCAYDESAKRFATNWVFIPDFDAAPTYTCANTLYGCWSASQLVVHTGYANAGGFNTQATEHDYAFAIVGTGGKEGKLLETKVTPYAIDFNHVASGNHLYAFGYPAAGKFKGDDLIYCAGKISQDSMNANKTWSMRCDMTGGSSGGPWIKGFDEKNTTTASGKLGSVNSYRYSGQKNMYGPKFDSRTQVVWNVANTGSSHADVLVGP